MNHLLTLTAIIEAAAGSALLAAPRVAVRLLLGRLTGTALFALGVACWLTRHDIRGCAARRMISAMVLYNLAAVVILGVAGTQLRPVGVALWPAVVLHAAMTVWYVTDLLCEPAQTKQIVASDLIPPS